ncbi:hypothetical protein DP779_24940, partial [Salmonella enterica subsp. enterica serovar Bovismorbificans]|nr:hypothetical protein [Salmonella enterica subsp. enterica serovar Bovismorbificans]
NLTQTSLLLMVIWKCLMALIGFLTLSSLKMFTTMIRRGFILDPAIGETNPRHMFIAMGDMVIRIIGQLKKHQNQSRKTKVTFLIFAIPFQQTVAAGNSAIWMKFLHI